MRMAVISVGFLVAACGGIQSPAAGGVKLYAAVSTVSSQSISVIDSRSHLTERHLPLGVPSSDWKHLYSLVSTSLVDTDPQTGATLGTLPLGHAYRLPDASAGGVPGGLSPNGRWLILERYDATGNDLPSATHLLLVETPALKLARRIDLDGFFSFDAVSNDGQRLYLIQLLQGNQYYVRLYDVGAGVLDPDLVVDKSEGAAAMSGVRLSGVGSRGGDWLFSMYVRDRAGPFIHALNLDAPFALCLDLPGTGYADDGAAMQWSLAMSPDGTRAYAVNLAAGTLAVLDTGTPQILRIIHIAQPTSAGGLIKDVHAKEIGGNSALVSPDGRTLVVAGMSGVVWIDTETLAVRSRALNDWHIWSVGLSPDGQTVYAVSDGGKIAEISMASARVGATFDLTGGQPLALMRVAES
jgi:hypothetical protein